MKKIFLKSSIIEFHGKKGSWSPSSSRFLQIVKSLLMQVVINLCFNIPVTEDT